MFVLLTWRLHLLLYSKFYTFSICWYHVNEICKWWINMVLRLNMKRNRESLPDAIGHIIQIKCFLVCFRVWLVLLLFLVERNDFRTVAFFYCFHRFAISAFLTKTPPIKFQNQALKMHIVADDILFNHNRNCNRFIFKYMRKSANGEE